MELQQLTLLEMCLHSAGATAATTTTPGSEASGMGTSSTTATASGGPGATATTSATPSGGRGAGSDILIDLADLNFGPTPTTAAGQDLANVSTSSSLLDDIGLLSSYGRFGVALSVSDDFTRAQAPHLIRPEIVSSANARVGVQS